MLRNRLCFMLIALTPVFLVLRTIRTTDMVSAATSNSIPIASRIAQTAGDSEWLEGGGGVAERMNWSGYVIQTSDHAVSQVHGSWIVPTVTCRGGDENSSVWLGIDGYHSNTIEQLGTEQDCRGKTAHYFAWYEMYPAGVITLDLLVHAGDHIQANITYIENNQFALELANLSTGATFLTTESSSNAQRSSAEWIVDAPGVLPLADVESARFANSQATISGTTGTISSFSQYTSINMVALTGAVKTQTFGLSKGGANFTVVWYRP